MSYGIGTSFIGNLTCDEDVNEVRNLYDKIKVLENKRKPILGEIDGKIKKEIKKFPVLFTNFRWVKKYSTFVLCGKYVMIGFDREYNRYVYLISNNSKDDFIKTLSYSSYSVNNNIVKYNTYNFSAFISNFFDNLETNIPEAHKQYMRMKKLERIIGQNDEDEV